ncbi:protein disulfide-isomerase [Colletotrichum spaethianum]|uniref:Protein disulfide-isomerase n=1 Tax=Colletotrichum spaethianum TaxID=700344 RepID=A0AA37NW79_9PEZI|nr:protein disulfide-isomerase [Colletotrichum spaethianum]GKT44017.1 protein disulfide-isomerase [Colletotrichum spaethianum]
MSFKTLLPLLALAGAGFAWQHKTEAEVRDALKSNDFSLVACYDASKALEQHWSAVEEEIPSALSVDCLASPSLCADLDVVSFPAIRLYRQDGTKHHFRGPRKASEITAFVRRMLRPAVTPLDKKSVTSFRDNDEVVMIAHMAESETNLRERFADLAERYRDRHAFGLATVDETPGRIGCYNNADGAYHMTSELDDVDAMENLLRKCASQLVPRLTRRNEAEHLSTGKSLTYFFSKSEESLDAWTSAIKPLARKYHQYITFVTVDLGEYPEMPALFGLPADASEGVAVQNPAVGLAFPFKGEKVTVEAVEQLIVDISEGNADAWQVGSPASEEDVEEEVPSQAGEPEVPKESVGKKQEVVQEEEKTEAPETGEKKAKAHDEL